MDLLFPVENAAMAILTDKLLSKKAPNCSSIWKVGMMEPLLNDFNIVSDVAGIHSCIIVFKIKSMLDWHRFVIMVNDDGVGETPTTMYRGCIYTCTFMRLSSVWRNAKFIWIIWRRIQRRAVSQYELILKKNKKKTAVFWQHSCKVHQSIGLKWMPREHHMWAQAPPFDSTQCKPPTPWSGGRS